MIESQGGLETLSLALKRAKKAGGVVSLIAVTAEGDVSGREKVRLLASECHASVIIENLAGDPLGLVTSLVLKKILNLVSNGAMLGAGKVVGNIMIDVSPANNKLIDRSIRIVQELLRRGEEEPVAPTESTTALATAATTATAATAGGSGIVGCLGVSSSPSYGELYELVTRVFALKKLWLSQHGVSIPAPIRVILDMLRGGRTVQEAIDKLQH